MINSFQCLEKNSVVSSFRLSTDGGMFAWQYSWLCSLIAHRPVTARRKISSATRRSSIATCPGAELLLPTAKVAAEP